ncbi:MAG: LUD domain-containing protein [Patescibacteria group bacterium]
MDEEFGQLAADERVVKTARALQANNIQVVMASNSGSQLPAYAYGAGKVIWVVGVQKITANLDAALKRIYEYVLPLESERVKIAYGMDRSNVSKLLVINKEIVPQRITMILVKERLGF